MPDLDGATVKKAGTLGVAKKSRAGPSEPALSLKMLQDELQALARDLGERIKNDMRNLFQQRSPGIEPDRGKEPPVTSGDTLARRISDIGPAVNEIRVLDTWDDGNEFSFSPNLRMYGAAMQINRADRHRPYEESRSRHKNERQGQRADAARQNLQDVRSKGAEGPQDSGRDSLRRGEHQKDARGKTEKSKRDKVEKQESMPSERRNRNKSEAVQMADEVIGVPEAAEVVLLDEHENIPLRKGSQRSVGSQGLRVLVKQPGFDYLFAVLVMLNTLLIGVQIQIMAKQSKFETPDWCRALEILFTLSFIAEFILRLAEIVLLHLTTNHTHVAFVLLRVVRMLRALRILRRYNIEAKAGELNTLVASLMGSVKAFFLACVVMFLIVYIFAVFVTYLVLHHRSGLAAAGREEKQNDQLERYYGTLSLSVLTLFQTISGGCDWGDALDPLYDHISPQMSILFSLYIAFVVFAVMNVITGVFVEAALDNAKSYKDSMTLTMVRNFMGSFLLENNKDSNDATVTYEMFKAHLNDDWMQQYFKSIDLDVSEAKGLFSLLDIEGVGEVLAEDFLSGCMALRGSARSLDLRIVRYESKRFQRKVEKHARLVERHLANLDAGFHEILGKLSLT